MGAEVAALAVGTHLKVAQARVLALVEATKQRVCHQVNLDPDEMVLTFSQKNGQASAQVN